MRRAANRCAPQIANLADSRDQYQHQHDDRESEAGESQAAHQLDSHPQRDIERDQPDDRPQHLAGEDRPRRAVLVVGVHPRGGQHHDQAKRGEQRGDGDDEVKRRHRPAQPRAEPGARSTDGLGGGR
jgi:hypothetical protein